MTANNNDRRPANVDEAGIRLAPQPLDAGSAKQLPSVRQEFVIAPSLDYPDAHRETDMPSSTARDYQPEEKDVNKKWKRTARNKNMVAGVVMLIASAAAIVPFLLAFFSVNGGSLPFKYIPEQFNVVRHWVDAFSRTAALGWKGDEVNTIWLYMVPDIIVSVGIIGIVANLVQSVFGIFGAIKPARYLFGAALFALAAIAVFVTALVGAEDIGVTRIDLAQDFVANWKTCEYVTLFFIAGLNLVCATVSAVIAPQRTGYTR